MDIFMQMKSGHRRIIKTRIAWQPTIIRLNMWMPGGSSPTRLPYCIESNKLGIAGQGDSEQVKDEAVKILTDANMKKLLYFGWGSWEMCAIPTTQPANTSPGMQKTGMYLPILR